VSQLRPNDAAIRAELLRIGFGAPLERPTDNVELSLLEDAEELWHEVINKGRAESQTLFLNEVKVVVTDADIANACAFPVNGTDVVAVTKGLLFNLHGIFNELLRHPMALTHVGVSQEERLLSKGADMLRDRPRCLQRREFSVGATRRALEFVLVHELAHHFYGHLQYLRERYHLAGMTILRMAESSTFEPRTEFQAMEIQADRHAADVSLMRALAEASWDDSLGLFPPAGQPSPPLEHVAIQEWALALAGVFHLVAHVSQESETHPHPKLRRLASTMSGMLIVMSRERLQRRSPPREEYVLLSDTFLKLTNETHARLDKDWKFLDRPAQTRTEPSEEFFRGLMDRALVLQKELPSRFQKDHII
jgi:hypothetical protein